MEDATDGRHDAINPMVPNSVGALLAEEWTIDPQSTLPSFLEMTMIDEARRSAWQALKTALLQLEHQLQEWGRQSPPLHNLSLFWKVWSLLRVPSMARFIAQKVIGPSGPEIRLLIVYWLERRALLSTSSATITEALYGGMRVKLGAAATTTVAAVGDATNRRKLSSITKRDGLRLALLVALGQYLVERGEWIHRKIQNNSNVNGLSLRFKKIFGFVYPFLYTSTKGLNLLLRWRFLLGQSVFFDVNSQLLSLVVRRVTAEDTKADENAKKDESIVAASNVVFTGLKEPARALLRTTMFKKVATGIISSSIIIAWVARLQMARREIRRRRTLEDPDFAPPPPKPLPSKIPGLRNCPSTCCPLCRQPRINPTASTGGYVFCLVCLTNSLREKPVCPITGKACPESSIVRLFEPHNL